MSRNCIDSIKWLSVIGLAMSTAACVSKPSISITTPSETASIDTSAEPSPVVAKSSRPNLDGVSGPKDADAPTEFTPTSSGLEYRILRKSEGTKPSAYNNVTVHYAGWLDNGVEFDSSYKRGEPASFKLNEVVAGWTEGLQLVGEGGMIELKIPSKLGYGPEGSPGTIPPNATLHFLVELLRVR